jgi:hypothetical protein
MPLQKFIFKQTALRDTLLRKLLSAELRGRTKLGSLYL